MPAVLGRPRYSVGDNLHASSWFVQMDQLFLVIVFGHGLSPPFKQSLDMQFIMFHHDIWKTHKMYLLMVLICSNTLTVYHYSKLARCIYPPAVIAHCELTVTTQSIKQRRGIKRKEGAFLDGLLAEPPTCQRNWWMAWQPGLRRVIQTFYNHHKAC